MDSDLPTPLHIIQDSRYAKQDGWRLDDISLCSSGNIAVSGHNYRTHHTYMCIYGSTTTDDNSDSRDKPTLLYHRQFTDEQLSWPPRYISFIKPNSTEIVTCRGDEVQVIDYNRDVVLRSREVNGDTTCLSVSESQIFIGLFESDIVNIYDNDLNRIKSIRLKGIRDDWPVDIAAAADILCVCTVDGRAIVYSQDSGSMLTEYTTGQYRHALSIAVNIQLQIVAVLWKIGLYASKKQVALYSYNSNNCLVVFDVESGVTRIRISDKGRIVTGNEDTGESKIYKLGDVFMYNLSAKLAQLMSSDEIKELRKHFNVLATEKEESSEHSEDTLKKKKNAHKVLMILKGRGILYPNKANELKTLFDNLGDLTSSKLSGPIHLYQKFSNVYADIQEQEQPEAGAGRLNDSFSVIPSHVIPQGRFPKQDNWHNQNVVNVVNTTHGLVCYIRSGEKREPNVLTQLFKLPNLDSSDNPQIIYSKVVGRQGYKKLFLTFVDETRLVMCYNKTLEIIDINSEELLRGHQLHAAAKTIDIDEGEIFIVVGDSSEVLVFNPDLEEITKLTFTLKDWKYPSDMKVTSERLFIICKVKPRDHDRPYHWPDKAVSFRREDGEVEAYYTFPGGQFTEPVSIAAHKKSEFVGVLWSKTQPVWPWHSVATCMVSLHSFSGSCVFLLDVEHSHTIQILNKNIMVVINQTDGLNSYNMAHFFTSNILAIRLSSLITLPECTGLQNFYGISDDEINCKDSGSRQFGNLTSIRRRFLCLFKILEEKDLVGPSKLDDFVLAVTKVRASLLWSHVEAYLKLQDIMQRASFEAGPSVQIHVPVTQEGGAESLDNASCQEGTSAQSYSLYPGGSHLHSRRSTSLQPQQQNPRQLHQQANLEPQQHDQGHAAAFQHEQVGQQQPAVTLEQVQQHADQVALRQQSVLHQQQLYWQQWQQYQSYQEQPQVRQGLGRGYIQAQQYHQPVGYSHSLGFNQPQSAFAQRPSFQPVFKRPTEPYRQPLPAIYSQEQGVLHNQQQAVYNAQTYSQLPDESTFVQHQQEQCAELPYQQEHVQQMQQQQLQQYPPYQPHTSLQHQVLAPSHDELGQQALPEQMTGRQGTISLSSFQHHQQELQNQPGSGPLPAIEDGTVRDKRSLFVECLKKKITSLSEMNYFAPWENFSRWKSTDLFVGCWLTLNDTNSMASVKNIENECKLKYIEIFTHERLKSETRIIIEGGPGTGKTMLLAQLALTWCEGNIEDVDTLIFLPLKIVVDKTLIQAIKEFYIPENTPLSGNDIADILASDTERICLLLDGLEEYSGEGEMRAKESSDVRKVIKKEKYPNCKVVVTCRSHLMHDLSDGPLLKIGQFGETERKSFIEKLALNNIKKEEKMKQIIEDDSFLLGLCSIPLLFALAVHNIVNMSFAGDSHLEKVAPFVKNMIETLWALSISGHETWSESDQLILGELAFNGLCKGQQQFSWPMDFIETKISRLKHWIDSRILVMERDMTVRPGKEYQNHTEDYERHDNDEMDYMTEKTGSSQSLVPAESHQHKEDRQGRKAESNEATVAIRFLHEIVQEWFAATYLCYMMNYYINEDQFHECVINQLNQLSPKDQHYVLRFTSYLHPRSCHAIINYLLTNFVSDDASTEPHVMNYICLCFAEHNDIKETDIKNSVTEVCKEVISVDFEDGRFLQEAKSSLLHYASDCGVTIKEVQLCNVISAVDETSLTLNSGTKLGQLDTLQVIEVSQWEQVLHQDDFENILKLLSKGNSIETILCVFPCHPPKILHEEIIENVISKDLEVEWNNGEVIWSLDPKKQIFNPMFGTVAKAGQIELRSKEDDFMSFLVSLPGTSSTPFGKWPTKRPLSKTLHSGMKFDIAAKRLKMNWNLKIKSEKENQKEEEIDLSEDSMLEEPSTSYVGEKFVKEETPSEEGIAQALIKIETPESDSEQKYWTVSPTRTNGHSQDTVCLDRFLLQAQETITQFGGTIEIPDTGVVLRVPPNALPEDMQECLIEMKIIPISMSHDEATPFSSNSSVRVELLPNHFKFRCHVALTLPHCLELKKNVAYRGKVFMSHHSEGQRPQWEVQKDQFYDLQDRTCTILLKSFCWTKFDIDDEIVEGKRLKLYTAAKKMYFEDMYAAVEVGYHLDMPGEQEILKMNPNLIVEQRKPFVFLREGKHPLSIRLVRIIPHQWKCNDQNLKVIPFHSVAASVEHSCPFVVEKETQDHTIPMCVFIAAQIQRLGKIETERTVELMIRPEVHPFATPWDVR